MTKTNTNTPDAWLALVLRTMNLDELTKESANPENTDTERQALRRELLKRKGTRS